MATTYSANRSQPDSHILKFLTLDMRSDSPEFRYVIDHLNPYLFEHLPE
jgi:hypothetical protein